MSLDNIRFARSLDIVDANALPSVCIIGVGGIGSAVTVFLSKMGVKSFAIYDPDTVELHNIANQMFTKDDIDELKVTAATRSIHAYSPRARDQYGVIAVPDKFTEDSTTFKAEVVISALDSIAARREVWKALKWEQPELYIDARMGGETAKVYAIHPDNGNEVRFYEASLEQDEYVLPCTAQAISYNCAFISAMVCSIVKRHTNGDRLPRLVIGDSHNLTLTNIWG